VTKGPRDFAAQRDSDGLGSLRATAAFARQMGSVKCRGLKTVGWHADLWRDDLVAEAHRCFEAERYVKGKFVKFEHNGNWENADRNANKS